jgi:hypothetical protein
MNKPSATIPAASLVFLLNYWRYLMNLQQHAQKWGRKITDVIIDERSKDLLEEQWEAYREHLDAPYQLLDIIIWGLEEFREAHPGYEVPDLSDGSLPDGEICYMILN